MSKKIFYIFIMLICIQSPICFAAEPLYFLCGSDEDGCISGSEQYCACIPYSMKHASKPYCLDFDDMRCKPLSEKPTCATSLIFKDQGTCLATMFQSEPSPPCPVVSKAFCEANHTYICDEYGHPESCHSQ